MVQARAKKRTVDGLQIVLSDFKGNLCANRLLYTWRYIDDIYAKGLKARDEAMITVMKVIIIIRRYVNNNAGAARGMKVAQGH